MAACFTDVKNVDDPEIQLAWRQIGVLSEKDHGGGQGSREKKIALAGDCRVITTIEQRRDAAYI